MQFITTLLINPFVDRFNEGGPFMMTLILLCFLGSLFFIFKSANNLKQTNAFLKSIDLLKEISLLAIVLGVFGSLLGLVSALDSIDAEGQISSAMFAGGIKVSFLTLIFGTFTFIVARISVVILKLLKKDNSEINK